MKKKVLSLFLALTLCLSLLPTAAFAESTGEAAQEMQSDPTVGDGYTADEDPAAPDEEAHDEAVEAAQALIDALPDEVTEANAEELEARLIAIDEALDALDGEQYAQLDLTRYEAVCEALANLTAEQAETENGHTHYLCGGDTCNKEGHAEETEKVTFTAWDGSDTSGTFYLTSNVTRNSTLTVSSGSNLTLCLNGYSITMNQGVQNTDVIKVESGATFTLCDCKRGGEATDYGTIGHTQPSQYNGRGVTVEGEDSWFTMYGGKITNNMVGGDAGDNNNVYGGGVLVCNKGGFSMIGGEITNNTARYGGGVAVGLAKGLHDNYDKEAGGIFNMHGGRIYGNTCTYNGGGGVYASTYETTFTVSDAPQITDNVYAKDTNTNVANNVYLSTYTEDGVTTPAKINVSTLTSAASIGVTVPTPTKGEFTSQLVATDINEADAKHFFSDASDRRLQLEGAQLTMVASKHENHPICGKTCTHTSSTHGSETTWIAVSEKSDITSFSNKYYLTRDITLDKQWVLNHNVTLCLNGYSIIADGDFDAIKVSAGYTFTLCDCVVGGAITHAEGKTGRGVYMTGTDEKKATFNMYGGTISGNTGHTESVNGTETTRGGGVYVDDYAQFNMRGGSITGNTAAQGGGVYYESDRADSFTVSGNVKITGNQGTDDKYNNVYVKPMSSTDGCYKFTIGDGGLGENAKIGITFGGTIATGRKITFALYAERGYHDGNFTYDNNGGNYGFKKEKAGDGDESTHGNYVVNLYNGLPHEHPICGKTCTHTGDEKHTDVTWTALTSEDGKPSAGETALTTGKFNETEGYVLSAGRYYLSAALALDKPLLINKAEVYLCLNGQTLTVTSSNSAVIIDTNGNLTLCDCVGGGTITHGTKADGTKYTGRGVYLGTSTGTAASYNGSFTMYGGSISGNRVETGSGSGVYMEGKGTFNMYGGSISGNTTMYDKANGGGVHVNGGTFTMTGGSITGNYATGSNASGGGVYVVAATFNMSGNAVISNNETYRGGGVYVDGRGTFNMSGKAAITGNTASATGGGVYVAATASTTATFKMSGNASVSGNSAKYGGGVYVAGGMFNMSENAAISGNNAGNGERNGEGGGVCVSTGTFNMTGGSITGNNVYLGSDAFEGEGGGGVYVAGNATAMNISGDVQIHDNWKNGKKNGDVYEKGENGSANNLYLFANDSGTPKVLKTVAIDTTTGLASTAMIGVTTCDAPTDSDPIQFATGATENSLAYYTNIFTPDVTDKGYTIDQTGTDLYLRAHTHHWKYANDGEAAIKVTCDADGCNLKAGFEVTYTLTAPAEDTLTYDGNGKPATVVQSTVELPTGVTLPTPSKISYTQTKPTQQVLETEAVPTNAGTYTAEITVDAGENKATASVTYTIQKATPQASDFTFTAPENLTYDGNTKTATVTSTKIDADHIAVKYYQDRTEVSNPTNAGTYTVKIDVAESGNYNPANGLTKDGEWTFTIQTNNTAPLVTLSDSYSLTYNKSQLKPPVTVAVGGNSLTEGTDYEVTYGTNTNAGKQAGSVVITAKGNYGFTQITQNFDIGKRYIEVKAENKSSRVGQKLVPLTYTYTTGLPYEGDTFSGALATTADNNKAGKYEITQGTLTLGNNYNIDFKSGTYIVQDKMPQDDFKFAGVVDGKVTKIYGTDKEFTLAATGAAAGSTVTYTSSNPTVATVDKNGKVHILKFGTTTITATAAETDDYAGNVATYELTVNKLRIPVPTEGTNKLVYNGKEQTYTPAGMDTTYCEIADNTAKDVRADGTAYNAHVSLKDPTNTEWDNGDEHDTAVKPYEFRITPAPATVKVLDKKITAGQAAPELTDADYTVTGRFGSDSIGGITLYYADPSAPKTEVTPDTSKAGTYAIAASFGGTRNTNYDVTFVNGTLTITNRSSSGGGGSSTPTYPVAAPSQVEHGTVTVSPKNASRGSTVTITVKPEDGFQLAGLTVIDKDGNKLEIADKGDGKYTFVMPAGKVEVKASFTKEIETSPFADVATDAYYYEAVKWAAEQGITGGTGSGLFSPDSTCTRAQIVTFLWRAAGAPEPKAASPFRDVVSGRYYEKAVAWAIENGITAGTSATAFRPDAPCTRAQAVTFLARAAKAAASGRAGFRDVPEHAYYAEAVKWAADNGITSGIGKDLFGPDAYCTRAQIVTFLWRLYAGK